MYKHVLLPTDGSELSEKAVARGIALAKAIGARVTGITVSRPFQVMERESMLDALTTIDPESEAKFKADQQARERLEVIAEAARAAGVPCETAHVYDKHPYQAIIDTAARKGCDVVVMASHGRRGVARLLLGSQTEKVLTHSKIPMLVSR
jgi:nucleotide-binding universal stress UspA family protein